MTGHVWVVYEASVVNLILKPPKLTLHLQTAPVI